MSYNHETETETEVSGRKSRVVKGGLNAIVGSLLLLAILIGVYWLAGKSNKSLDLTREQIYTLSNNTRNLLGKLEDRVTFSVYATEKGTPPEWTEKLNELRELLNQYRSVSGGKVQYTFNTVTPGVDDKAAQDAGMEASLLQESSATEYKIQKGYFGLQAEYRGQSETLPFIPLNEPLEYQLTRIINKVAAIDIPKVGLVSPAGNPLMGQESQFSLLRQVLEARDFEVTDFQPTDLGKISDVEMLFLVDPQNLSDEALFHIDQYVMNGGKLFVAAPGVQLSNQMGMSSVTPNPPNINQLLEYYGLRIEPTLVEDWGGGQVRGAITRAGTLVRYKDPLIFSTVNVSADDAATSNLQPLMFAYTSSVSRSDRGTSGTVVPLVQTSENARLQRDTFTLEATELKPPTQEEKTSTQDLVMLVKGNLTSRYSDAAPPVLTNGDGTTRTVDESSIKKRSSDEARVMVAGSALFLVNQVLEGAPTNALLPLNLAELYTRGGDLLALSSRSTRPAQLRPGITPAENTWTQVLIIGGIPALLIIFGFVKLYLNRRRKAKYRRIYATPGSQARQQENVLVT